VIGWLVALVVTVVAGVALVMAGRDNRALRLRTAKTTADLERLQASFSRFAPSELVDRIATEGLAASAHKREVTMLFADLIGFTAMSDKLDPSALVEILNGYFSAMSEAIARHHGQVSKFIGDGILALFGAHDVSPWQTNDAVHAALAMRDALASYNRSLSARALPLLRVGIGIHRGTVVAGVIGSERLLEFTVIGDAVNVASRVESLTRKHGVDILVTEEVRTTLDPGFALRAMPPAEVKGKPAPIVTWAVDEYCTASAASSSAANTPSNPV
jgi:adenylate cyclase